MAKSHSQDSHAIVFHGYPKLIYIWPVILMGPLFLLFAEPHFKYGGDRAAKEAAEVETIDAEDGGDTVDADSPVAANAEADAAEAGSPVAGDAPPSAKATQYASGPNEVLGWIYIIVLFIVILTIGVDVERNYAIFWVVVLAAVWLLCWLLQEKDIPIFSHIYRFFANLNVSYDQSLGLVLSLSLALPYVTMLIWARLNNKWRITHNEFEHYAWGRADDSLARGAKRVRSTYPDIFEFLLCGAGTLIVYSATGRSELRRIHNVPLLFIVRKRINRILEATRVTTDEAALEEEIGDEAEDEAARGAGEGGEEGEIGNERL